MRKGILLIVALLSLSLECVALDPNGFERFMHIGHVYARSAVKTSSGGPVWAEYYDNGGYSQLHSLNDIQGTVLDKGRVLSNKVLFEDFKARMNGKIEIYKRDQFTDSSFELKTLDDRTIQNLPPLPQNAVLLVVPAKSERLSDSGLNLEHYAFPFDVAVTALPTSLEGSVFFDEAGNQQYESDGRIGPMTAYYTKGEQQYPPSSQEYESNKPFVLQGVKKQEIELLNPIAGAYIDANTGYDNVATLTEQDGSYRLHGRLSPCPGFSYSARVEGWLKLHYSNFSPRGTPSRDYYLKHTGYHSCVGLAAFPPDYSLVGLMVQLHAQGLVLAAAENIVTLNYAVAVSMLSGVVFLPPSVSVGGETVYSADATDSTLYMVSDDYDGDGEIDEVKRGLLDENGQFLENADGDIYGVFFSTSGEESTQPDITRIVDVAPNFAAEGLLSGISEADLGETDIYIFRESTGQLITEINGLENFGIGDVRQSDVGNDMFSYTVAVRGPEDQHSFAARFNDNFMSWQAKNKMNPDLQAFNADHLTPGETLRVVAINRPTGYIGSVTAKMGTPTLGGYIGTFISPILLGPPNLKVWATRRYQPEGLLQNSDTVRKKISNGGAATTEDYVIEVHTEWMDSLGYPLPVGLSGRGYTGRLTKQIGEGGSYDNAVREFEINPGRQMQVLKFSGGEPLHYYFQVNGNSIGEQNDFSSIGVGGQSGDLSQRLNRYVPIKVPLYDEQNTLSDRLAIRNSDLEDVDEYDVEPQFNWVYRPEMSFSTVDILISGIEEEKEGDSDTINLLDVDVPVISNTVDFVKLLFELVGSEYDRITSFDGEQEFTFAIGAQEIKVSINKGEGEEQQISFSNLEHLSSLEVEDFLTMSLYLNHDSQNTLWEWGFENLIVTSRDADNDLETDDTYYVSADDPVVPMIAILSGYSDREPELKKPMTLRWKSDNGELSVQQEVNDTSGIFKTELTMPVQAGSQAHLTAELAGSDNPIEFKTIEVVPGAPANIVVNQSSGASSLGVLGTASQQYEITITDAHGNIVQDGTSVTYSLEGYAEVTAEDTGTTSGKAYVTVTGTERFDDAIKLNVTSGSATRAIDLSSAELGVSLDIPAEIQVGLTREATVSVTNPVGPTDGMEVAISAPALGIEDQSIVLDENGQATFTLIAPPVPAETYVHARVGYAGATRETISVVAPDAKINADNYRPLMGESTQAGSYAYTRFDDAQIDLGYDVEKSLTLQGTAGEVLTAQLGDAYYPNAMPELALAMDASMIQSLSADSPKDDTGTYSIDATGVTLDGSSLYGAGSSTRFDGSATITATASSLGSQQRPNWAIDIKPEQAGTILNLAGGQSLSIGGNELVYRVTTTDGIFQARAPIQLDKWQRVAARVTDTQLELYVDDLNTPYTTAYSGSIQSGSGDLTIGTGYAGLMQGLRFYDGQSQPLLAINNSGSSADIQTDASGSVSLTVNSLGNLNANGESLGLTYVHLVHNGERVHIPVISEDAFKQVAGAAANIGLAGPPLAFNSTPDYNITDPWAPRNLPFSSVMPQAQAFGWLDALDFIIPVSSIMVITEQIGRIGTEEFEPVTLIIAGLDVALVFSGPLRGPLKLAFDPLAKLISNPATQKLAKILGPFFGNIIEKVAKSRSIDPILNLLPFLMIVGEIAADEEAREAIPIIIDAINSSEDLQVWFDYFNLPDDGWEGDTQPPLELELASLDSNALPLGMLVPQAYAAVGPKRISGAVASKKIRLAMKGLATGRIDTQTAAASITRSMAIIIKEGKDNAGIRKILTDPKTLKAGATMVVYGGVRYFQNLLRGRNGNEPSRTPVFLQLAAIAYLESNIGCDGPQCWDVNEPIVPKLRLLYSKAFADAVVGEYGGSFTSGYRFHLVMTALLHAWGTTGTSPYGGLIDIEAKQDVFLQSKTEAGKWISRDINGQTKPDFTRFIDIVTQVSKENRPRFIELKSYKGQTGSGGKLSLVSDSVLKRRFPLWTMAKGEQENHKQFILDRILATDNQIITEGDLRSDLYQAKEIHWMFQKFKLKTTGSLTDDQLKTVRKMLARNAKGSPDQVEASLGYAGSYSTSKSEKDADKIVKLFGIKSALGNAQSTLVNKLFDLGNLSDDDKEKLKTKITEMVLDRLDESD